MEDVHGVTGFPELPQPGKIEQPGKTFVLLGQQQPNEYASPQQRPGGVSKRKEPLIQQRGTQAKRQADGEHDVGELLECMQPLGSSDLQRQGSPNQ